MITEFPGFWDWCLTIWMRFLVDEGYREKSGRLFLELDLHSLDGAKNPLVVIQQ